MYMRIAIVAGPQVSIPPNQYGGTEQVVFHLIKGLKEAGHEPILLGAGDSKVDCEVVPIVDTAIGFALTKKDLPAFTKRLREFDKIIAQKLTQLLPRIDLIHSNGYDIKAFSGFPHLVTLHNKVELTDLPYYAKRQNLNYVSISRNQQQVVPHLRFLSTVYNGEDPRDFPLVTKPEPYVCFLGRFDQDKNPHLAIQLALSQGIKIKLGGKVDHDSDHYFNTEIAPYLKHPLVEYLGELNFKQKVKLLSHAVCNLHSIGFREPFGLTVLEAAYCGTPTLANRRGSMPELIEHGRSGILVEDYTEAYYAFSKCVSLDRQYVASRARLLFNYQVMTKQYVEVYHRILEDHKFHKRRNSTTMLPRRETLLQQQSLWNRQIVPRKP
ncbi:MAG: glycosyltransferase family 4 protein [Candidatus Saccharimonadales bacterium]